MQNSYVINMCTEVNPELIRLYKAYFPRANMISDEMVVLRAIESILKTELVSDEQIMELESIASNLAFQSVAELVRFTIHDLVKPYLPICDNCNYCQKPNYFCALHNYLVNPNFYSPDCCRIKKND